MEKVSSLSARSLVGRLEYCLMEKEGWLICIARMWKPLLCYAPTINSLSNGWYVFIFIEEAHAIRVLNGLWLIDKGSLMLWRRWSGFDPGLSKMCKRHLWVLLSDLPLPPWTKESLWVIGNILGRFITFY